MTKVTQIITCEIYNIAKTDGTPMPITEERKRLLARVIKDALECDDVFVIDAQMFDHGEDDTDLTLKGITTEERKRRLSEAIKSILPQKDSNPTE